MLKMDFFVASIKLVQFENVKLMYGNNF